MELYLFKSAAILAILFAFYKLVLENTSIHTFKRIYLFVILLASFLIPFITFTSYVEVSPVFYTYTEGSPQLAIPESVETINYWPIVLWTIYGLGALFFSVKFFRNLFIIVQQIRTNPKYRDSGFINILLSKNVIPHTFFNYIFLNKKQFERGEIPSEVILHEQTHAIQKHSLDVIFVELLQIVFWFNPFFYFLKKSMKLNHEFLADRAVLNAGVETSEYQKILLAFSSNAFTPALANSINYSSIKKRFTVMKAHTSKRAIWLRSLLILPLFSVLIYGFSTKEVIQKNLDKTELTKIKATEAEIAQYNNLAKKYNAVAIEKRIIPLKDLKVLETIYKKMTDEQKADAQPFPECISPPPNSKTTVYNFNRNINTNIPVPSTPSFYNDNKNVKSDGSTVFMYEDMVITTEKAAEILFNNQNEIYTLITKEKGHDVIYLSRSPMKNGKKFKPSLPIPDALKTPSQENGNLYMAAEAPPAPNANKLEYIKELAKRGAIFYIGPDKYTSEEAIELVKKSTGDVTIDVSKYPLVQLGGC